MSNTITNVLPKLLAQGVLALRQNAIMPRLVNRDLQNLAAQRGNVINVPVPAAIAARTVTPAVSFAANVDVIPTAAVVTLDFWKEAPFQLSDNDYVSAMDGVIPMQASEAIKSLGNAVDQYILGKTTGIYGFAGVPGTTPFQQSLTAAASARVVLNRQNAPINDRRSVLDVNAENQLLINSQVLQFDTTGQQDGIIDGSIGRKLGVDWYLDQNVQSFTPGTAWITGWSVATGGATAGNSTMTIINSSVTAAQTILIGDLFTVGGSTQQYVITANQSGVTATATVGGNVLIAFTPSLATTVASAVALTVIGTAHVRNLMFHRDAFAWASRPLSSIAGHGAEMMSVVDPVSGIALRLEVSRQYKQTTFSYDILGGANLIRPELACLILG
jgi:hypothetical protein